MARMVFDWKPNARLKVGAQIVGERLKAIESNVGTLTPEAVVDDAKSSNSPLHALFTWDDNEAAKSWRLHQARNIINHIIVSEVDDVPVARETRAFVHVTTGGDRYVPVERAMAVRELREEVLARAHNEIMAWRSRYAAYAEFAAVHSAIDEVFAERAAKSPGAARRGMAAEASAAV